MLCIHAAFYRNKEREEGDVREAKPHGFTRRNFIKGAAVLTAAGALAGCMGALIYERNDGSCRERYISFIGRCCPNGIITAFC